MRTVFFASLVICCLWMAAGVAAGQDRFDPAKLVGTWTYVAGEKNGDKVDADRLKGQTVVFTKENLTLKGENTFVIKYELDAKKTPVAIKMTITDGPFAQGAMADGIIELKGDELKFCYALPEKPAPKEFDAKAGSAQHLFILKRAK